MGDLSINLANTLFSEVLIQDFQWVGSPATNAEKSVALLAVATDIYEQAGTLDIGVNWSVTDRMDIPLSCANLCVSVFVFHFFLKYDILYSNRLIK